MKKFTFILSGICFTYAESTLRDKLDSSEYISENYLHILTSERLITSEHDGTINALKDHEETCSTIREDILKTTETSLEKLNNQLTLIAEDLKTRANIYKIKERCEIQSEIENIFEAESKIVTDHIKNIDHFKDKILEEKIDDNDLWQFISIKYRNLKTYKESIDNLFKKSFDLFT